MARTNEFYGKLSKELSLQQKWKDGEWLVRQLACKRISFFQLKYLGIHSRLLDEVYPNKWDMIITVKKIEGIRKLKITFEPVIKFENITISNTRKQSIPIKSIFVKIPFNEQLGYSNKYWIEIIQGMRNVVSYNEYNNRYAHSHLTSVDYKISKLEFSKFCTGNGEINFLTTKINQQFNEGFYKTLLFHLKGYLEWESLEGVPYCKLEDLFIKSKNEGLPYLKYNDDDSGIKHYTNTIIKRNILGSKRLDWILKDNRYQIQDNEKLEDYCRLYYNFNIKSDVTPIYPNIYFYKDFRNNYHPLNSTLESIVINTSAWFPFQGNKEIMKVEGVLENQQEEKYYVHPKIKENVKRQLENTINAKFNKDNTVKALQD